MRSSHLHRLSPLILLLGCGPLDEREQRFAQEEQGLQVCPTVVVEGVDVFDGQGSVAWPTVLGAGRAFAFTKATQGATFNAHTFATNWRGLRAAGVVRSPYHFFDATVDGVLQANHFLNVVADAGGFLDGDLPATLDLECPSATTEAASTQTCEGSTSGWAPAATVKQRALDWLQTVEAATGRPPIIYSYSSWFGTQGFTDPSLTRYPLYIASLNATCATVPAPWMTPTFWQYSFTGMVAGISSDVDLDRFVGSLAELQAFADADAGAVVMPHDAGTPDAGAHDGGSPPHDAGVPDAGAPPDAGMGPEDSGMPEPDAGLMPGDDAGSTDDGGTEQQPEPDAGNHPMTMTSTDGSCGCGSSAG